MPTKARRIPLRSSRESATRYLEAPPLRKLSKARRAPVWHGAIPADMPVVAETDHDPPPKGGSITRSILLSKFSHWTPRPQSEAFAEFRLDYGEMTTRNLCRILAELLRDGLVAKDDNHEYVRTRKEPDGTDSDTGELHPRPARDGLGSLAAIED